jgi:hypothetical protein
VTALAEQGRQGTGRRRRVVALVLLVAALGACSGSDDADADGASGGGGTTDDVAAATTGDGQSDGGTVDETVPTVAKPVVPPVAIDEPAAFGDGVTASLTDVEDMEVEAFLPGEVGGPGVSITIEITNGSSAAISLDNVTVDLIDASGASATPITTHEDRKLKGQLPAGETRAGTYVFTIAVEDRADVALHITYAAPKPTVVFEGDLADA